MDQATLEYYARHAREVSERYEGVGSDDGIAYYVRYAFPEPCKILDVGCGSGRDAARLLANGYDVYGVEPCVQWFMLSNSQRFKQVVKDGCPDRAFLVFFRF